MSANPKLRSVAPSSAASSASDSASLFDQLGSRELVVALSGPLGSGVSEVRDVVSSSLRDMGYETVTLKVSELIRLYSEKLKSPVSASELSNLKGESRYTKYQDLGNQFRSQFGNDFLSCLVATHISLDRQKRHPNEEDPRAIKPKRVAYLVDQLKHPDECQLLRTVYRDNFYLVGVFSSADSRKRRLKTEGIESAKSETLMERDRREDEKHGQKLEKTLQLADYFVRNSKSNTEELKTSVARFLRLIHGSTQVLPTRLEQGMYAAYSAALASACLSRQVGAAIHDRHGVLIATGCNDVPRGGGGLYQQGQGEDDRCAFLQGGVCFNHLEKDEIRVEVQNLLATELSAMSLEPGLSSLAGQEADLAKRLSLKIRNQSRLNDLIEFSRAVHAEMDALVSLARSGAGRAQDGVLFTTTYPCHNCARHIIAAGIRAVYFIEPYEKSLASKLHSDAIDQDAASHESLEAWDAESSRKRRVKFLFFEGVTPRRYLELFAAASDRKNGSTGKAFEFAQSDARKKQSLLLESYVDIEARLAEMLVKKGIDPVSI